MEQRGLLAKEEAVRWFAPVGQRERETHRSLSPGQHGAGSEVKRKTNRNMPQNRDPEPEVFRAAGGKDFCSPAHLLNVLCTSLRMSSETMGGTG